MRAEALVGREGLAGTVKLIFQARVIDVGMTHVFVEILVVVIFAEHIGISHCFTLLLPPTNVFILFYEGYFGNF